jgi:hypothetical protein
VNLDRADLVPGVTLLPAGPSSRSQELNAYFNTSAFTMNALGTFGDSPRNPLRNPNYFNVDAGLQRMFPIIERIHFKFRVEEFNATNHVHFNQPGANVSAPTTFGKITGAGDPRILQLVGRLEFLMRRFFLALSFFQPRLNPNSRGFSRCSPIHN